MKSPMETWSDLLGPASPSSCDCDGQCSSGEKAPRGSSVNAASKGSCGGSGGALQGPAACPSCVAMVADGEAAIKNLAAITPVWRQPSMREIEAARFRRPVDAACRVVDVPESWRDATAWRGPTLPAGSTWRLTRSRPHSNFREGGYTGRDCTASKRLTAAFDLAAPVDCGGGPRNLSAISPMWRGLTTRPIEAGRFFQRERVALGRRGHAKVSAAPGSGSAGLQAAAEQNDVWDELPAFIDQLSPLNYGPPSRPLRPPETWADSGCRDSFVGTNDDCTARDTHVSIDEVAFDGIRNGETFFLF